MAVPQGRAWREVISEFVEEGREGTYPRIFAFIFRPLSLSGTDVTTFPPEPVRDSAVSNAGIPSSAFMRQDTSVHLSAGMSFLAEEKNPNSASTVEQGNSGNAVFLSRLRLGAEGTSALFLCSVWVVVEHLSPSSHQFPQKTTHKNTLAHTHIHTRHKR